MAKIFRVREASEPSIVCHNPDPTPEMEEFAVKQEFKNEVDINRIIANHERGIQPPAWMTSKTPRYGDFSEAPATFQEAFALVAEAKDAFMALPLAMRKELDHDPRNLDHADRDMYARYGLLNKADVVAASGIPDPSTASAPTSEARQPTKKPKTSSDVQKPPSGEQND